MSKISPVSYAFRSGSASRFSPIREKFVNAINDAFWIANPNAGFVEFTEDEARGIETAVRRDAGNAFDRLRSVATDIEDGIDAPDAETVEDEIARFRRVVFDEIGFEPSNETVAEIVSEIVEIAFPGGAIELPSIAYRARVVETPLNAHVVDFDPFGSTSEFPEPGSFALGLSGFGSVVDFVRATSVINGFRPDRAFGIRENPFAFFVTFAISTDPGEFPPVEFIDACDVAEIVREFGPGAFFVVIDGNAIGFDFPVNVAEIPGSEIGTAEPIRKIRETVEYEFRWDGDFSDFRNIVASLGEIETSIVSVRYETPNPVERRTPGRTVVRVRVPVFPAHVGFDREPFASLFDAFPEAGIRSVREFVQTFGEIVD